MLVGGILLQRELRVVLLRLPRTGKVVGDGLRVECRRSSRTGAQGAGVIAGIVIDCEVAPGFSWHRHVGQGLVVRRRTSRPDCRGAAVVVVRIDIGRRGLLHGTGTAPCDDGVLHGHGGRRQVEVDDQVVGHRRDGDRGLRLDRNDCDLHVVDVALGLARGAQTGRTTQNGEHGHGECSEEQGEARSHHAMSPC